MNFRKAINSDIPKLKEIFYQNYYKNGGHLASELSMPKENNIENCYVALEKNEPIGYAQIYLTVPKEDIHKKYEELDLNNVIYMNQVAVDKAYQNKGVGTYLYEKIKEHFDGARLSAHVRNINPQSMTFHKKNGFVIVGEYYNDDFYGIKDYMSYFMLQEK